MMDYLPSKQVKSRGLGLHWFRRGFGRGAGHVEVLSPRKTAEKK